MANTALRTQVLINILLLMMIDVLALKMFKSIIENKNGYLLIFFFFYSRNY